MGSNDLETDLNDLALFVSVAEHGGFSAAARATGLEKTRLSRRVAALEQRMGVRLFQRTTRIVTLTDAGERFYARCRPIVDGARAAFDSISELKAEPAGSVRISSPLFLAQTYLAQVLPDYMTRYPKVSVFIEATDRTVNLVEERFDLALRTRVHMEDTPNLVARELGRSRRVLVACPSFLDRFGRPSRPEDLLGFDVLASTADVVEGQVLWPLSSSSGEVFHKVPCRPRLVSGDLPVQRDAAIHGIGITLLPEHIVSDALFAGKLELVLPQWSTPERTLYLVYPPPRGMLPSVRSLIDHLLAHIPRRFLEKRCPVMQTD